MFGEFVASARGQRNFAARRLNLKQHSRKDAEPQRYRKEPPKASPTPSRFHKKLWTRGGAELELTQKKAFAFQWEFYFCEL